MRKLIAPVLGLLLLGACTVSPAQYQANVTTAQKLTTALETNLNLDLVLAKASQSEVAKVTAQETTVNTALAALAASPEPTNFGTVLTDVQGLINAAPPNMISQQHLAEANALILLLQTTSALLPQT